jgi:protease I
MRVAILVEEEFEDRELTSPRDALVAAGIEVTIVGPVSGRAYHGKKGVSVTADAAADRVKAADFDAVVVPGGHAPDKMRLRHAMVDLVRDLFAAGKPVAAICHGPSLLINANVLKGRTLTCWPSIAVDVKNAGGRYVDRPVVEDGPLITSRKPDDLPQFNDTLLRRLADRGRRIGEAASEPSVGHEGSR